MGSRPFRADGRKSGTGPAPIWRHDHVASKPPRRHGKPVGPPPAVSFWTLSGSGPARLTGSQAAGDPLAAPATRVVGPLHRATSSSSARTSRVGRSATVEAQSACTQEGDGPSPQIRPSGPVGLYPRIREAGAGGIRIRRRPPVVAQARQFRQRETGEVFDLREGRDHGVRVSIVSELWG